MAVSARALMVSDNAHRAAIFSWRKAARNNEVSWLVLFSKAAMILCYARAVQEYR